MGCLKTIIKIIIIALAIVGFKSLGGLDMFKDIKFFEKPSQEKLQNESSDVADFSNINNEYKLNKRVNIMGYKAVVAEHKGSGQKMFVLKTGKKTLLTKNDFTTKEIDKKLEELVQKVQYQFIRVEDFKIIERGSIYTMGQNVPYVRYEANTVNLPAPTIQGIIGVATDKNNESKLILSLNDGIKYSQIITQQFFKDVK